MTVLIKEAIDVVMEALRLADYAPLTMLEYEKAFRRFTSFTDENCTEAYSPELGARFAAITIGPMSKGKSEYRRKKHGRCIRLLDSYYFSGTVNLEKQKCQKKALPATEEYRSILTGFLDTLAGSGLSESTINGYRNLACGYLMYLEDSELYSLSDMLPATIEGYLISLRDRWQATAMRSALAAFRPFIRYLGDTDLLYAVEQVRAVRQRVIIPVLSDDENARLWEVLTSDTVSARDKSIVFLGLLTGIRACDIIALQLGDIDWQHDRIRLIQRKTGNPLTLPLVPVLGNALYVYITNERPDSECENVFLRSLAPYIRLSDHASIYHTIKKVFTKAHIEHDGRVCGARLLRQNAATKMLASGVSTETISAVLGHADPASTDVYLSVDDEQLLKCVLDVEVRRV
jgi:integrase